MTTEARQIHWQTIIDNQATSGMNIAAYCRESHIHPSLFYTWRRKLRKQQPCAGGFLELIPGRLTESVASGIRIRMGEKKLSIEVARGFDPVTLRAVVETLVGASRCSA